MAKKHKKLVDKPKFSVIIPTKPTVKARAGGMWVKVTDKQLLTGLLKTTQELS
jgi:hypothetical protein